MYVFFEQVSVRALCSCEGLQCCFYCRCPSPICARSPQNDLRCWAFSMSRRFNHSSADIPPDDIEFGVPFVFEVNLVTLQDVHVEVSWSNCCVRCYLRAICEIQCSRMADSQSDHSSGQDTVSSPDIVRDIAASCRKRCKSNMKKIDAAKKLELEAAFDQHDPPIRYVQLQRVRTIREQRRISFSAEASRTSHREVLRKLKDVRAWRVRMSPWPCRSNSRKQVFCTWVSGRSS